MKTALMRRLNRLEAVHDLQESNRRLKIEVAYLKQLPREYTGPRHIVTVGRRSDGREECEERPGEPPPDHERTPAENVLRIYIVYAAETTSEIREPLAASTATDMLTYRSAGAAIDQALQVKGSSPSPVST